MHCNLFFFPHNAVSILQAVCFSAWTNTADGVKPLQGWPRSRASCRVLLLVHADLPLAITFSTSQWCKHLGNTRLLQHPHRGKLRMRPQKHGDPQDPWQQGWWVPGEEMGHVDGVGAQQGSPAGN